jgi:fructose-specific phosphotransferase system component IIB
MEAVCNNCSHWEETNKIKQEKQGSFGLCNELTDTHINDPEYVIPVLNEGRAVQESNGHFEMITGANFGCNHFDERTNRF